jgi:CRISPR/Cas system CSM-associated protein Csm3 (group 7 of RAMP superfamily)
MKYELEIKVLSYWHAGSGLGKGADLDAIVARDSQGMPYLPGKSLKGIFREAAMTLAENELIQIDVDELFGLADKKGKIFFTDAVLNKDVKAYIISDETKTLGEGLYERFSSTSIKDGVADKHTLRSVELCGPVTLHAVSESDDDIFEFLQKCSSLIRGIGGHRSRGLGRCAVTVSKAVNSNDAKNVQERPAGHRTYYSVELLSNLVLTEDSATEGGHSGLDYIPGSAFLGAVISKHGGKFNPKIFLTGKLRFFDAYPAIAGKRSLPMPLLYYWHKLKGWKKEKPLKPEDDMAKQWRSGYFTSSGEVLEEVWLENRMKTAVDRETGKGKDTQLFGYESIPAGLKYIMCVEADSEDDAAMADRILHGKELRVGRSRTAEYGMVRIERLNNYKDEVNTGEVKEGRILFYLESDLALICEGMPKLLPVAADFGLSGGYKIDLSMTSIRCRQYSPWNSFFKSRMTERHVICRGSVIAFKKGESSPEADLNEIKKILSGGIGMHREEGMGQVRIHPEWLINKPVLNEAKHEGTVIEKKGEKPELVSFLEKRKVNRENIILTFNNAAVWAQKLKDTMQSRKKDNLKIPGRTQWSAIRELAAKHRENKEELSKQLTEYCCKTLRSRKWHEGGTSVYTEMEKLINGETDPKKAWITLYHAASAVRSSIGGTNA